MKSCTSPESGDKADPFVGRTIMDKYRVVRQLGRGGMGAVYEGTDILLDRQIAIKVMHPEIIADHSDAMRFIREAKTAAKLDHPNTLMIHDFGVLSEGGAFIVMEFIKGQSLRARLAKPAALSLEQSLDYFLPICAAVEEAHLKGIIHRDLKPENIMLKETDAGIVIKVVDFGLAKLAVGDSGNSYKLTDTGEVIGTPQYMPPELFEGEEADARSDVYSLGIIFYEMITGSAPFTGSFENVITGHLFKRPKPPSSANSEIPASIDEAINLALEKKRDKRIASALAFAKALTDAVQESARRPLPAAAAELPVIEIEPSAVTIDKYSQRVKAVPAARAQQSSAKPTGQLGNSRATGPLATSSKQTILLARRAQLPVNPPLPSFNDNAQTSSGVAAAPQASHLLRASNKWLAIAVASLMLLGAVISYRAFVNKGGGPVPSSRSEQSNIIETTTPITPAAGQDAGNEDAADRTEIRSGNTGDAPPVPARNRIRRERELKPQTRPSRSGVIGVIEGAGSQAGRIFGDLIKNKKEDKGEGKKREREKKRMK